MGIRNKDTVTLLTTTTDTAETGTAVDASGKRYHMIQITVSAGTGTIAIEASLDGVGYDAISTTVFSTQETAVVSIDVPWPYLRAVLSSGTGCTSTVTMKSYEQTAHGVL